MRRSISRELVFLFELVVSIVFFVLIYLMVSFNLDVVYNECPKECKEKFFRELLVNRLEYSIFDRDDYLKVELKLLDCVEKSIDNSNNLSMRVDQYLKVKKILMIDFFIKKNLLLILICSFIFYFVLLSVFVFYIKKM